MSEPLLPRVLAAAKEFNIGQDTLVDFLIAQGFVTDELKPTAKLTQEMYQALQKEYQSDRVAKNKADLINVAMREEIDRVRESLLEGVQVSKIDLSAIESSTRPKKGDGTEPISDGTESSAISRIKAEKLEGPKILGKIKLPENADKLLTSSEEKRKRQRIPVHRLQQSSNSNHQPAEAKDKQQNWESNSPQEGVQFDPIYENSDENEVSNIQPRKYGRVASFDLSRGYGFINSYRDRRKCFVHISKILVPSLTEGDIVTFQTKESEKHPGELEAINVGIQIPLFVFKKTGIEKSFAVILDENELDKQIMLSKVEESGFILCFVKNIGSYYAIQALEDTLLDIHKLSHLSELLFKRFLADLEEHEAALQWLLEGLQPLVSDEEFEKFTFYCSQQLRQLSVEEIIKTLRAFKGCLSALESFKQLGSVLNKFSFGLWFNGYIDKLPKPLTQAGVDEWKREIVQVLPLSLLQETISRLLQQEGPTNQVKATLRYVISTGWDVNSIEELDRACDFIETCHKQIEGLVVDETAIRTEDFFVHLEMFKRGLVHTLSEEYVVKQLASFASPEEKAQFLAALPPSQASSLFALVPDLKERHYDFLTSLIEQEIQRHSAICFDLETDRQTIREFAWKAGGAVTTHMDFASVDEGIGALLNAISYSTLIVGQNIKVFDLPVLQQHGDLPDFALIWDTLEIEMLINPFRHSYALLTQHSAKSDTNTTYDLFLNQLLRLSFSPEVFHNIKELLPEKAIEIIQHFSNIIPSNSLPGEVISKTSDKFFRPAPSLRPLADVPFQELNQFMALPTPSLLIAPELFWSFLMDEFDINFWTDDPSFNLILDEGELTLCAELNEFTKKLLKRFMACSIKIHRKPFLQRLPLAIRLRLPDEIISKICKHNIKSEAGPYPVCASPTNIAHVSTLFLNCTDLKVCIIGEEIYNLIGKTAISQTFDFATLFDKLKQEPIWLQLSGGKSFVEMDLKQCQLLGIHEFPSHVRNIWLEKIGRSQFQVWCNLKLRNYLEELPAGEIKYIENDSSEGFHGACLVVRPDFKKSGYFTEQKRVNPESLYRKLYWPYQFKLFEGIIRNERPTVIVINDEQEINSIIAFARRKGYFVPDRNASLARQLELLHQHSSIRKLMIAAVSDLQRVISSNYEGSINIIWDSFLLNEKAQMMKDFLLSQPLLDEDRSLDEITTGKPVDYIHRDTYSLISLYKVLVHHFLRFLSSSNEGSRLYLTDPRLADYNGIERTFKAGIVSIPLWSGEQEYNEDYNVAAELFTSLPEADPNIDLTEAKEVLRHIFLSSGIPGEPNNWYDYQIPCLDEIIPAKKDLLISLPTGAGKSVLFQAPALFRSAFTSKLTIVISPLRALMQDQVNGLWDKGFYSNVDFLSGDKSFVEVRDINRRIAGGELTLLYITPERFRSRSFENCLLTRMDADNGLEYVVFDEAHCISQWGQEFRPDYLNAGRKIAGYSRSFTLKKLLFSATISDQVFNEIIELMPGISTVTGSEKGYNPVRDHIRMSFKHNVNDDERLTEVAEYLRQGRFNHEKSRAIIFVKSRKKSEECAFSLPEKLKEVFGPTCGFAEKVGFFHAGMDAEDRKDNYDKFKDGEIVILFATKAFGMGMDIPNIHFVSHHSPPGTFEDFLQEVGRAGRDKNLLMQAGFSEEARPIDTVCLTSANDFRNLKDQLHESRISWHEVKEMKEVVEEYYQRFKPLVPDDDIPVALPFNLYSAQLGSTNEELDNKFRIGLHWLERLERIKLGYFTITHLEFEDSSLQNLSKQLDKISDIDSLKVCKAVLSITSNLKDGRNIQVSISTLRDLTKLSLENIFKALLHAHGLGLLKLQQEVVVEPTNLRKDEILYYYSRNVTGKYAALRIVFDFAIKVMNQVPANSSKVFDGELLDDLLNGSIHEILNIPELPWPINPSTKSALKKIETYVKDIKKKRSKHAFTIIRLLSKAKHETKMEKQLDYSRKAKVTQSIFNGYHKKQEWLEKLLKLEHDCARLLDHTANFHFKENTKSFNWPDLVTAIGLDKNVQHLSNVLFVLSVLGYAKSGSLLPTGIEVYLRSTEPVKETDLQSDDKQVFDDFEEVRKVRELKLIGLEVLAGFHKSVNQNHSQLKNKQDNFIKRYFACSSLENLLSLLQDELPPNDPMLAKWRGDAIKVEEDKLNLEQKKVYDAEISQHINVMAGPGSGKTHTLTLRVARLIHHKGIKPEEILVLAYNRAVVSELKERLGKLFAELGYGNIVKRIKIFTFHGLAKKYCQADVEGKPFEEWETILLTQLESTPGSLMTQLAPLKHILVDEFQDINKTRIQLLNKLQQQTKSYIFIIGDPNQSIYGYERTREGGSMGPWPYYDDFGKIFHPTHFTLLDNHRSYPEILETASQLLMLRPEHKHLIPRAVRNPDKSFMKNYVEVIDRTTQQVDWWTYLPKLLSEKNEGKLYRQIAVLFRTNNEVYRGLQKIKSLNLSNIRIRIQGNSSGNFTRIRECYEVILYLKCQENDQILAGFLPDFKEFILSTINDNPDWNHFYLRVIHAIVLEYFEGQEDEPSFKDLLDFIEETSYKDDGQLYKIYEKHKEALGVISTEIEIVLTTMHKVKGLEFDCVVIPPSFSNLPVGNHNLLDETTLQEQFEEERRLAFVAYTRARFRLVIIKHSREHALMNNQLYQIEDQRIGVPAQPDIKKLNIGWAAGNYVFASGVNDFIRSNIKSGDFLNISRRTIPNNGRPFNVHELFKVGTTRPIGQLSQEPMTLLNHATIDGFVINEIYVWTYDDTCVYDQKHGSAYASRWCPGSISRGYIYLVDFAGYGTPIN